MRTSDPLLSETIEKGRSNGIFQYYCFILNDNLLRFNTCYCSHVSLKVLYNSTSQLHIMGTLKKTYLTFNKNI